MARATLPQRLALFIEAEMAGKTDRAELAAALERGAAEIKASIKPADTSNDRPVTPPAPAQTEATTGSSTADVGGEVGSTTDGKGSPAKPEKAAK